MAITAAQRKRLIDLEAKARMFSESKRNDLPAREPTPLDVLWAHAWIAFDYEVKLRRSGHDQFELQAAHEHQLMRAMSFSITARFHPEKLDNPKGEQERAELHKIFAVERPEWPGVYAWSAHKHPDALTLYIALCAGEYL